ncbi:sugar ABC transporter permease [Rhodobacter ferrooxidans]|uniref:Xylose transport system permease protein XylH n=1 Tax=Rhodobacter ferrooxidans TaxID=371731 RepID=C8S143_9RHOB|nr:sugar ABC transporter permease [Rhodobacter sp. SW2]EEW25241.1 inner-membrane translocator [Rhodobacter sp. SW2]
MTDAASNSPKSEHKPQSEAKRSLLQTLEVDTRLLGMIGAFLVICLSFQFWTGIRAMPVFVPNPLEWLSAGRFFVPQNTFNITIQTVSVAIMAAGMVFVIVMRHIDLSVGSLLALCSSVMAVFQTQIMPNTFGFGLEHPLTAPLSVLVGILTGVIVGSFQGWLIGYQRIPSFIVTLGGLLIWSRVAYFIAGGQTVGPLDGTFLMLGGTNGTIGVTASWILGAIAAAGAVYGLIKSRRARAGHGFPVKPVWAEAALSAIAVAAILGFVALLNSNEVPTARLRRLFAARGETMPEGYTEFYGIPISVLLLLIVALVLTVMSSRTRLGRYIYATGGNPDAAELSGINTRLLTVKVFGLMGGLCGISAAVASARLSNHSLDLGSLDELRVIAAAVIGGTALAGGMGTVYGAILGALIMQSLQSGMAMVGVDAPFQNIVVGMVLVLAVWIDIQYRKRTGV